MKRCNPHKHWGRQHLMCESAPKCAPRLITLPLFCHRVGLWSTADFWMATKLSTYLLPTYYRDFALASTRDRERPGRTHDGGVPATNPPARRRHQRPC